MRHANDNSLPAAVRAGDSRAVESLLLAGADPDARDSLGYPVLCVAAGSGSATIAEALLEAGADPVRPDRRMGATALHKAAQRGAVPVARLLLEHGAFIDAQAPSHGFTPLIEAVWNKRTAMVRFLLDAGANSFIRAHEFFRTGSDAREIAEADGPTAIVTAIDEARDRVARREQEPLRLAALKGDAAGVRAALASGAAVDAITPDGHTALLDAAREGHTEVVRALLGYGADARIVDHLMRATPAHKAAYMGRTEALAALIELSNVELDARGPYNGYTALHDAVWHGWLEAARLLLDAGATPDVRALDGRTPLDMAREYHYQPLVELLSAAVAAGDDRDARENHD